MAKLPTFEELAQELAYEGKTIREWIEIIKAQPAHGTDSISRAQAIEVVQNRHMMLSKEKVLLINDLENLPPVQPYTIHSDGRLWITVDDIDKVTAVVVDEYKSKFCKQFYEDYEDAQPEIVHCGECRHYVFDDDRMDRFPIRGCSVTGFRDVDAGDFCSRAERREVTT